MARQSKENIQDYIGVRKAVAGQSLGELEAQILDIVWELGDPVTTGDVFKVMYPRRGLSYSTIMLTMAKLSRKGILKQEKLGTAAKSPFRYTTNYTREQLGLRLLDEVSKLIMRKPIEEVLPALFQSKGMPAAEVEKAKKAIREEVAKAEGAMQKKRII